MGGFDPMQQVTIRMSAQRAFELRYILPILSEALSAEPNAAPTMEMLAEAVEDVERALPPELAGVVEEDKINEWRMDAIDKQREAGVRPATPPNLLSEKEIGLVLRCLPYVLGDGEDDARSLSQRLSDFADSLPSKSGGDH